MLRAERQAKILQTIRERGVVENEELSKIFDVSLATIRRDLKTLSDQRLIKLDHGGSTITDYLDSMGEPLYETKVYINEDCKAAIGAAAAQMIQNGDTIILDSGTTNAQIARHLRQRKLRQIEVITCDLMVAKELGDDPNISVLVLGGLMRKSYYTTYGPYTEQVLRNIQANKTFLGVDAVSKERGVSNIVLEEVPVKELSIRASEQVIMVADSTKFGKSATYRVCGWDAINIVITDDGISSDFTDFFNTCGLTYKIVKPGCASGGDQADPF
jgi:DeoR/GlpR family transcriptional regulator of sugar metabolism